jgi:hypothetical protein
LRFYSFEEKKMFLQKIASWHMREKMGEMMLEDQKVGVHVLFLLSKKSRERGREREKEREREKKR